MSWILDFDDPEGACGSGGYQWSCLTSDLKPRELSMANEKLDAVYHNLPYQLRGGIWALGALGIGIGSWDVNTTELRSPARQRYT